jgi:hypothetical protein
MALRTAQHQIMKRSANVLAAMVALSSAPSIACADDDFELAFLSLSVGALLFGTDVMFTVVNVRSAVEKEELEEGWMVAQTIITSPQAVFGNGLLAFGAAQRKDQALVTLTMPVSIWFNQLATFSSWSLGSRAVDVGDRLGVSWMIAANLTLTSTAVASTISPERGHVTALEVAIPELVIAIPETVGSAYALSQDDRGRAGWIALTAWSGALVVHGTVAVILGALAPDEDEYLVPDTPPLQPPSPEPEPPVKVVPEDYRQPVPPEEQGPRPLDDFIDPKQKPSPRSNLAPRRSPSRLMPRVTPTALTEDGKTFVPGMMVSGRF